MTRYVKYHVIGANQSRRCEKAVPGQDKEMQYLFLGDSTFTPGELPDFQEDVL